MSTRIQVLVTALLLSGFGCSLDGGQSGGEIQEPTAHIDTMLVPCPCPMADRAVAVMATLSSADECGIHAVVDGLVAGGERVAVEPGDELWGHPIACADTTTVAPGDPVFLLYAPLPPQDSDADAGSPLEEGQIFLVPAGQRLQLDVGEPLPQDLSEASAILLDFERCVDWAQTHPAPGPSEEAMEGVDAEQADEPVMEVAAPPPDFDEPASAGCR
ncbi:MAG: hypothetical protein OEZ06_15985 [Myxococcales bacterium]|nr:hypothetical protein [Myxococcales bacterium]